MEGNTDRPAWKTLLAFAIIYFVWGSTFLAIRVGLREVPPLILGAMRFLVAGVALYSWMMARGVSVFTRDPDLRLRLRSVVLGRAARAFRHRRSHAGADVVARTMVVCPTSTPATSVIASSGAVGRTPTFNPRSEKRGRGVRVVFWAAANAVASKTVATAKSLLVMGIAYDQIPVSWHRLGPKSTLPWYFCFRLPHDFR